MLRKRKKYDGRHFSDGRNDTRSDGERLLRVLSAECSRPTRCRAVFPIHVQPREVVQSKQQLLVALGEHIQDRRPRFEQHRAELR